LGILAARAVVVAISVFSFRDGLLLEPGGRPVFERGIITELFRERDGF
jgi:hypothetical protein